MAEDLPLTPSGSIETAAPPDAFAEVGISPAQTIRQQELAMVAAFGSEGRELIAEAIARVRSAGDDTKTPRKQGKKINPNSKGLHPDTYREIADQREAETQAYAALFRELGDAEARYEASLAASAQQAYDMRVADKSAEFQAQHDRNMFDLQSQAMEYDRRPFVGIPREYGGGGGGGGGGGFYPGMAPTTVPQGVLDHQYPGLPSRSDPGRLGSRAADDYPRIGSRPASSSNPVTKTGRKVREWLDKQRNSKNVPPAPNGRNIY